MIWRAKASPVLLVKTVARGGVRGPLASRLNLFHHVHVQVYQGPHNDLASVQQAVLEGALPTLAQPERYAFAHLMAEFADALFQEGEFSEQAFELFDMTALLRSAVAWVAKAQMQDVEIVFDLPERLEVAGHPGHLHQVVMNLVQNAIDAMHDAPRKTLELHGHRDPDRVTVTIRDSGPGIPDAIRDRVFDPFFTTKPVGKGTGLGLSISYQIVHDHGGALEAANHPAGGALFTLTLPAPDERATGGRRS